MLMKIHDKFGLIGKVAVVTGAFITGGVYTADVGYTI